MLAITWGGVVAIGMARARSTPAPRRRVRRTPDEARRLILDAAERTFARFMPAEVGLREVAEAAGVTHGLVTHYFGTYDELVAATLARRLDATRDQVLARLVSASFGPDELPLIDALIELVHEPLTMRLLTWSLVSGRGGPPAVLGGARPGLTVVIDGIIARITRLGHPAPPRARIEFATMAALAMALGFAIAGPALHAALGADDAYDRAAVQAELKVMVRRYVDRRAP